jgi:hypothetical protein
VLPVDDVSHRDQGLAQEVRTYNISILQPPTKGHRHTSADQHVLRLNTPLSKGVA